MYCLTLTNLYFRKHEGKVMHEACTSMERSASAFIDYRITLIKFMCTLLVSLIIIPTIRKLHNLLQIFTSLGMLISRISTPFCKSLLLGILPLLISSALCVMYGSRIMLATATTSSPLV
jgi:hypothetical protein